MRNHPPRLRRRPFPVPQKSHVYLSQSQPSPIPPEATMLLTCGNDFLVFLSVKVEPYEMAIFCVKKSLNIWNFIFQPSNFTTCVWISRHYSLIEPGFKYYLSVILVYLLCAVSVSLTVAVWYPAVQRLDRSHCCEHTLLHGSVTFYYPFHCCWIYKLFPFLTTANNVAVKILVHVLMYVTKISSRTGSAI